MADLYNAYNILLKDLDLWIETHTDTFPKCVFINSWQRFENKNLPSTSIHIKYGELTEYDIKENKSFFESFNTQKEIGHFIHVLFDQINDIAKLIDIKSGSSMGVENGFITYGIYCSKDKIKELAELISSEKKIEPKLYCRINYKKPIKGCYDIYLHSDDNKLKSIEDSLNSTKEPKLTKSKPISKKKIEKKQNSFLLELLKSAENNPKLLKELKKISLKHK